jgi:hypothetical protein
MNKQRRKEIYEIIMKLQNVGNKEDLGDCINDLENVREDESEYFENIPENLQNSQRAYDSEEALGTLDDVLDELNDAYDSDDQQDWLEAAEYAVDELNAII